MDTNPGNPNPQNIPPIPDDRPAGAVSTGRLAALAQRVGPSLHVLRRRPILLVLLVIIGGFVVAGTAFIFSLDAIVHTRKEIIVPDLSGKTVDKALDAISGMSLSLKKDAVELNESFPPGTIFRQVPPPGLKVREGKVIRVTLSSGGKVVSTPELANRPLAEAQNLIRREGLVLGALNESFSEIYESGWVMDQSPSSGTILSRGQMIDLTISKGAPPKDTILMPNFINGTIEEATNWAKRRGFEVKSQNEVRADYVPGTVLRQSPGADTVVSSGTIVEFVVSRSAGAEAKTNAQMVRYVVPEGTSRVQVRIVLRDDEGERTLFEQYQEGGSVVNIPAIVRGPSAARIFVNGVLVEERVLE